MPLKINWYFLFPEKKNCAKNVILRFFPRISEKPRRRNYTQLTNSLQLARSCLVTESLGSITWKDAKKNKFKNGSEFCSGQKKLFLCYGKFKILCIGNHIKSLWKNNYINKPKELETRKKMKWRWMFVKGVEEWREYFSFCHIWFGLLSQRQRLPLSSKLLW